ncbi:hypothetical protein GF325_00385 [Candidatus Bathyarchaeota archaeon]|nr:hypothetical protein [Candidatus Bathyarchaeota archaeon]
MILHFELFLPQSEWRHKETIKRVRFFVQKHQHPSTEFGVDLESILAPVIKKIKHALTHAVQVVEPPLMSTRYLDFTALRADSPTQCLWTHCTLIGVMKRGFDPDGDHFQDVLLDVNVDGIQNYALRTNIYTKDGTSSKINGNHPTIFAYVESGDSLVCVPDMRDIRGRSPEDIAKEDWVYWIASHHYTWKLVWDLDRALYIILNRVTMNLKEKRVQKYKDVYKVSAFISNLLLRLDMHEPRNQTSVYYSIYFLERLNAAWRTGEILHAAREKMDVLRDLINQLDEIEDARKSRRMELFLNLLGVFALGSLVLDFIGALSIASTIPDRTVISIALGLPIVFSLVAARLSR